MPDAAYGSGATAAILRARRASLRPAKLNDWSLRSLMEPRNFPMDKDTEMFLRWRSVQRALKTVLRDPIYNKRTAKCPSIIGLTANRKTSAQSFAEVGSPLGSVRSPPDALLERLAHTLSPRMAAKRWTRKVSGGAPSGAGTSGEPSGRARPEKGGDAGAREATGSVGTGAVTGAPVAMPWRPSPRLRVSAARRGPRKGERGVSKGALHGLGIVGAPATTPGGGATSTPAQRKQQSAQGALPTGAGAGAGGGPAADAASGRGAGGSGGGPPGPPFVAATATIATGASVAATGFADTKGASASHATEASSFGGGGGGRALPGGGSGGGGGGGGPRGAGGGGPTSVGTSGGGGGGAPASKAPAKRTRRRSATSARSTTPRGAKSKTPQPTDQPASKARNRGEGGKRGSPPEGTRAPWLPSDAASSVSSGGRHKKNPKRKWNRVTKQGGKGKAIGGGGGGGGAGATGTRSGGRAKQMGGRDLHRALGAALRQRGRHPGAGAEGGGAGARPRVGARQSRAASGKPGGDETRAPNTARGRGAERSRRPRPWH